MADVAAVLARRQLMIAAAMGDPAGAGVIVSLAELPHAKRLTLPGQARGLGLLTGDPRLARAINGWLYAAMGPVLP